MGGEIKVLTVCLTEALDQHTHFWKDLDRDNEFWKYLVLRNRQGRHVHCFHLLLSLWAELLSALRGMTEIPN
jgi:hypothetical protein